eukprot:5636606-Pleurochrysis_carterae.AAC.2
MSATPLPWCTSQSSTAISTRSDEPGAGAAESRCDLTAAHAKLTRQKPIAMRAVAWCPGGRASANAGPSLLAAMATASTHAPVASVSAAHEPGAQ